MSATVTAMLNEVRSQLGFREGPDNDTPYGAWYGLNHQPYCAMGLSWCAWSIGALDIMHGRWASCPRWLAQFRSVGQFLPWTAVPAAGDIVFHDWTGHHDYPGHVSILESFAGGIVVTLEFNTTSGAPGNNSDGGGVYRRHRTLDTIVGFGRPKYSPQTPPVPASRSSARPRVPLIIDGVWGPLTTGRLQIWLGLPSLGILDPATRTALQKRLGVAADGVWGPITHRALQALVHVPQDGQWGPVTVKALQRFLNAAIN